MTPEEWERSADLRTMLEYLRPSARASDRKLRLFGAACCRALWPQLTEPARRRAVEVAELWADGKADQRTIAKATKGVHLADRTASNAASRGGAPYSRAMAAARSLTIEEAWYAAACAALGNGPEQEAVARGYLRDIFIPFRPLSIDPGWLAWHGGAIPKLAQAVYDERELPSGHLDAARLAVLADMLEEAGCTDPHLLGHLRGPGSHVRGCFAVDLLLGKG
jgi:hypothetical protein